MAGIETLRIWVVGSDHYGQDQSLHKSLDIPYLRNANLSEPLQLEYQFFAGLPQLKRVAQEPEVILMNFASSGLDLSSISHAKRISPSSVLVLMANEAGGSQIVAGLKAGANDFLIMDGQEDSDLSLPERIVKSYFSVRRRNLTSDQLISDPGSKFVGRTIEELRSKIPNIIASAISTIYVEGETGTGKEVVADLFRAALSSDVPFIKVNCGAIAPSLMESEFFGHVKGSFTGAINNKMGLIEKASGGYLFLDEVANLTREAQAALLRVIESQEVIRIGETIPRPVKVRFISATNEPLEDLVKTGKFRQDLWQRLTEKVIMLPSLRQRRDEIDILITAISKNMQGGPYTVTERARKVLREMTWHRGNIRELRNCLRAMTEYQAGGVLDLPSIPQDIVEQAMRFGVTDHQRPQSFAKAIAESIDQSNLALPNYFNDKTAVSGNVDDDSPTSFNQLTLSWQKAEQPSFDDLTDQLLVKMLERKLNENGKLSLRKLAMSMGMVRNTLSNRLKVLAEKNMLSENDLSEIFGRS